ncbi:hypothetical protein BGX34_006950, partial [Mortierella sp. NVP85]
YEDGYIINRKTGFVIDIYGRAAAVGVKLIQSHRAHTDEDGKRNQLWNVAGGHIQLLHNKELVINAETTKEGSRVQLVEKTLQSTTVTWTLELAQTLWLKSPGAFRSAVPKETSWFRRLASGAGAASGALTKVDGVWKLAVSVANTHKAKVDEKCPIHKHAFVYYDEDVYDSVVVDTKTGSKHVIQLLFDKEKKVYYVYNRWNENEYTLSESYETVEEAKAAYLIQYKKNFDIEWNERTTVVSERWTIELQVYKEYEEIEEVGVIIEETEALDIIKSAEEAGTLVKKTITRTVKRTVRVVEMEAARTEFPSGKWFYIKSKSSDLVIDVEHGFLTDPMKAGARLELNHQKLDNSDGQHRLLGLQLWRFEDGYIINYRTGMVLDIQGGLSKSGARLIQSTRETKDNTNQQWAADNGFIHPKSNANLVLNAEGGGT